MKPAVDQKTLRRIVHDKCSCFCLYAPELEWVLEKYLEEVVDVPASLERFSVHFSETLTDATNAYKVNGVKMIDDRSINRVVLIAMRQECEQAVHDDEAREAEVVIARFSSRKIAHLQRCSTVAAMWRQISHHEVVLKEILCTRGKGRVAGKQSKWVERRDRKQE